MSASVLLLCCCLWYPAWGDDEEYDLHAAADVSQYAMYADKEDFNGLVERLKSADWYGFEEKDVVIAWLQKVPDEKGQEYAAKYGYYILLALNSRRSLTFLVGDQYSQEGGVQWSESTQAVLDQFGVLSDSDRSFFKGAHAAFNSLMRARIALFRLKMHGLRNMSDPIKVNDSEDIDGRVLYRKFRLRKDGRKLSYSHLSVPQLDRFTRLIEQIDEVALQEVYRDAQERNRGYWFEQTGLLQKDIPTAKKLFSFVLLMHDYADFIFDGAVIEDAVVQLDEPDFDTPLEHELGWYLRDGLPVPPITRIVEAMDNGLVDFSDSRALAVGSAATWHSYAHLLLEDPEVFLDNATIPGAKFLLAALESGEMCQSWRLRMVHLASSLARNLRSGGRRYPEHRSEEVAQLYTALQPYISSDAVDHDLFAAFPLERHLRRNFDLDKVIAFTQSRLDLLDSPSPEGWYGSIEHLSAAPYFGHLTRNSYKKGRLFSFKSMNTNAYTSEAQMIERLQDIGRSGILELVSRDLSGHRYWGYALAQNEDGREQLLTWRAAYPELQEVVDELLE